MISTNPNLMGGHMGSLRRGMRRTGGQRVFIAGEWVQVRDIREQVEKGWHAFWARRMQAPPATIDFRDVK